MRKSEAEKLIERAYQAWDAEEWLTAAGLLERVLAHFPDEEPSGGWWYDAALGHKVMRNWAKAYELGREAAARAPRGEGDPAYWNLGIAATIQRDWVTARQAWEGFGITLPAGDGAIEARLGPACVRLDTGGEREVVWIDRLCPTRGRVMNVPVTAGRRYGEVVVHDGEPTGRRVVDGREYPVFDELLLFEPSGLPTLTVTVHAAEAADIEALVDLFGRQDYGAEPASSFETLCSCCSAGTLEQRRDTHAGTQRVSLAAPPQEARRLLAEWAGRQAPARSWKGLEPVG
ncbi:tetratricopeptide repeat protein [Streptomyces dangxiongensis]|uniref:Tetratricopeptide repeat protein n=1 Tax=Streptomyces dangxiongensis TaxID=1442032 RepID=A0A3G2JPB8_9ACTN|nr:tetratricopeptide repeat protein [Streptomyces dangxiongensis]AYN41587.1 tetratricopeptide repeat protein [Streptomyces dangxiongensis]